VRQPLLKGCDHNEGEGPSETLCLRFLHLGLRRELKNDLDFTLGLKYYLGA